ncbi:carbamate kinase [Tetragenococcus halophilus]|nr:carbamate kinase [Tetragenococcus halophilus]GEQ37349.1 carbamate kinase [Tetragenococcus halophilus]GEQ39534.1 carbamate kinase [Tetragenococcus halophilus]GEQ41786.1 carbamate kinase [Tetragenococcus halophilus]GEQ43984.1 carbamate kinase [Tetragenococcus halophilus]
MTKVVVALGGNALGNNLKEQMEAVKKTAVNVVDLIEEDYEVVLAHGNGPQAGMIKLAMDEMTVKDPKKYPPVSLSVSVAMSQTYIGYDLQNALREEMLSRKLEKPVVTIATQVEVDPNDPAFDKPTKPIGRFMSKEEAMQAAMEKDIVVAEDAGRGYRQVVASPKPQEIIEIETINHLISANELVITCGGGGIPVIKGENNHLQGVSAVIDKDFCSALLAETINADFLIILTAVEQVALNFGTPEQKNLAKVSPYELQKYINQGHFAPGSMLPKVEAAMNFVKQTDKKALITSLEKAKEGLAGKTGTLITSN